MRTIPVIFAMLAPSIAAADPGHIAEVAGHSHWIAGAALGAAAALGLLAWGKKDKAEAEAESDAEGAAPDDAPEGASA